MIGAIPAAPVPQPTGGSILDGDAAIRLGKALFWDVQAGSDGQVACATCHFRAGADGRTTNSMHPGFDTTFGTADDVFGSSGVFSMAFGSISTDLDDPVDVCSSVTPADPGQAVIFNLNQRLVTGRQAPPAVGAVFYRDNFWDGRARHNFNKHSPIGAADATYGSGPFIENASLASQAVGPPLSDVEMSCAGRKFNGPDSLGAKLVPRVPLAHQLVDPTDSVLGPLSNSPGNGLKCFADRPCTYADLIAAAFGTGGLSGQAALDAYVDDFASIWGQAIQAYEATLVPDRTPYDLGTLTAAQVNGLVAMRDKKCTECHSEPEFSDATVRFFAGGPANPGTAVDPIGSDKGYHNIGASLTGDDLGRAGSPGGTDTASLNNRGAFKTPTLRNVKLTAPYMHNGKLVTLLQVLDFYDSEGGLQVPNPEIDDRAVGAGFGGGGTGDADVVNFLANGLTDCRVEHDLAPFDHPALPLPNASPLPARGATGDGFACP